MMIRKILHILMLLVILPAAISADEIIKINEILAYVNDDAITLRDARVAAKWNGMNWESLSSVQRKSILEQLINRVLVFQEVQIHLLLDRRYPARSHLRFFLGRLHARKPVELACRRMVHG